MGTWQGAARRFLAGTRTSDEQYELLQQVENGSPSSPRRRLQSHGSLLNVRTLLRFLTLRRIASFLLGVLSFLVLGILWSGVPPSFSDVREFERRLPQHDLSLPFPEGEKGKYLRFPEHIWGHGLNNVLQEM